MTRASKSQIFYWIINKVYCELVFWNFTLLCYKICIILKQKNCLKLYNLEISLFEILYVYSNVALSQVWKFYSDWKKLNWNQLKNICWVCVRVHGKAPLGYFLDMRVSVWVRILLRPDRIPKVCKIFCVY